jgi:hypothetical protein
MEMVEPYLEKVVKSAHRHGMIFEFHCCGKNELLVPAMYKADIDIWNGQPLNDFDSLIPVYGDKIVFGVSPEPLPAIDLSRSIFISTTKENQSLYFPDDPTQNRLNPFIITAAKL